MKRNSARPDAFVLGHLGLNCERETIRAIEMAGATAKLLSLFELKKNPRQLLKAQILAIPGGFSFGDEVSSGLLAAQYIQAYAKEEWHQFLDKRPPVIGICNGFQILCQLNAFGASNHEQNQIIPELVLATNSAQVFSSEWKQMQVTEIKSLWFRDFPRQEIFALPVRHKSGRLLAINQDVLSLHAKVAITYTEDWNGSIAQAAGVINQAGNILGLMPHPEGAIENWQLPEKYQHQPAFGLQLFKNAVESV